MLWGWNFWVLFVYFIPMKSARPQHECQGILITKWILDEMIMIRDCSLKYNIILSFSKKLLPAIERPGLESQRSRKRLFFHRNIFKFFNINLFSSTILIILHWNICKILFIIRNIIIVIFLKFIEFV